MCLHDRPEWLSICLYNIYRTITREKYNIYNGHLKAVSTCDVVTGGLYRSPADTDMHSQNVWSSWCRTVSGLQYCICLDCHDYFIILIS